MFLFKIFDSGGTFYTVFKLYTMATIYSGNQRGVYICNTKNEAYCICGVGSQNFKVSCVMTLTIYPLLWYTGCCFVVKIGGYYFIFQKICYGVLGYVTSGQFSDCVFFAFGYELIITFFVVYMYVYFQALQYSLKQSSCEQWWYIKFCYYGKKFDGTYISLSLIKHCLGVFV